MPFQEIELPLIAKKWIEYYFNEILYKIIHINI